MRVRDESKPLIAISEKLEGAYENDVWEPRRYVGAPVTIHEGREARAVITADLPPQPPLPPWAEKDR